MSYAQDLATWGTTKWPTTVSDESINTQTLRTWFETCRDKLAMLSVLRELVLEGETPEERVKSAEGFSKLKDLMALQRLHKEEAWKARLNPNDSQDAGEDAKTRIALQFSILTTSFEVASAAVDHMVKILPVCGHAPCLGRV